MTEIDIGELLEKDLTAYNLVVQVSQQDDCLLIMLNRSAEDRVDYTTLTAEIADRIKALHLPEIHTLLLCSRVLGEYEVDWQTQLELISSPVEAIAQVVQEQEDSSEFSNVASQTTETSKVEASVELTEATADFQEFKLSDYCFTRNKGLLTFKILLPSEQIAKLVQFFHALPDSAKESVLPLLKSFFLASESPPNEQFDSEIQQWFEQLTALNDADIRTASIWLSRYCFNPEKTIAEVIVILEPEPAETTPAQVESQEEAAIASLQVSTTETVRKPTAQIPTRTPISKTRKKAQQTKLHPLALPLGWLVFTLVAIALAVHSVNPSELVAKACKNTTGKQEYCRLAVQLVGELTFHNVSANAAPLTSEEKTQSVRACEDFGNIRAGKTLREVRETKIPPVLSSYGEEVVPGIFLAEVKQTNFKEAGATVRTACAIAKSEKHLVIRNTDVIPNNWPVEAYKGKPIAQESLKKAMGVYGVLVALGAGTLFTAVGIFIAGMFSLGIRLDSLETLFKVAFLLGIVETMTSMIPSFSIVVGLALESLSLGVISAVIKGFDVEWANGYKMVAAGAITIIATRTLLNLLLLSAIASFFN